MDSVQDNPGEPVPEKTFTHYRGHQSSLICFFHLLWSMASSLLIHAPDSLFPQLLSKFSLVYLLAWHPPLHTPYISNVLDLLLFISLDFKVKNKKKLILHTTAWNNLLRHLSPTSEQNATLLYNVNIIVAYRNEVNLCWSWQNNATCNFILIDMLILISPKMPNTANSTC